MAMTRFDRLPEDAKAYLAAFDRYLHPKDVEEAINSRAEMQRLCRPWRTGGVWAPGRGRS
jgi:hypothetical protein